MEPVKSGNRLAEALRSDTTGGLLLIGAAAIALLWANSPWGNAYESVRHFVIGPAWLHLDLALEAWAADGLLALFFFIVGNELKQEFINGQLRDPKKAMVPIVAAVCGVVVPAVIFTVINLGQGGEAANGWGIPMATDVAFAIAILAIVGRHLPPALRIFLLTLAVVDDLIAILVIAIFYTGGVNFLALVAVLLPLGLFAYLQRGRGLAAALNRSRVPNWVVYLPIIAAIWTLVHASGVHATIAGVAMGLLMRTGKQPGEKMDPSHRAEIGLRPWAMGLALPIFALMSAGVVFDGFGAIFTDTVALGIVIGLVVGKLVGIAGGAWLTTKLTSGRLDDSLAWPDIIGMSQLAGIGFTVSLLISELSYPDNASMLDHAKSGVLIGSLIATILAMVVLTIRNRHYQRRNAPPTVGTGFEST
ncbi:sodium/proton antiporter (NhaA family) [Stackebrandtia endophytica]|uniref:Na(+)/H(+) antiporter NhaA n=1 Tax=Stackebrandtia endophytica TaxID=1496996 RepID=A0A543ASA2_9ACTN|nr:sodium/proton antiporter (NhaA family) [Stackebrandtia endophytica]